MSTSTKSAAALIENAPRLSEESAAKGKKSAVAGAACILAAFAAAFFADGGIKHFSHAWLVGASFVLSISLGGLFFCILQHLTAAGWSVVVRRQAEIAATLLPWAALMFVPVVIPTLFGYAGLFPWADTSWAAADPIVSKKTAFLNGPFFTVRMALYFGLWFGLARWFVRNSLAQDKDGDPARTVRMRQVAAPSMLAFALSVSFFAFDAIMSIDPHWFSTIFGVYYFAGCVLAIFAVMILTTLRLEKGPLKGLVNEEHYHDLGKWLFGFVFFWGYIAFSQYILIWYANIPEETIWYIHRDHGGWRIFSGILLFGHFIVPFLGLLSRHVKRNRKALGFWAAFLLVMHIIDLFWLVNPNITHGHGVALNHIDVLVWGGLSLLAFSFAVRMAKGKNLIPNRDPRLQESLDFTNI